MVGIEPDRGLELGEGVAQPAGLSKGDAAIVVRIGMIWLQGNSAIITRERFFVALQWLQRIATVV